MRLFHAFMQGAAQAAHDSGKALLDEDLSMVIDAGMVYMLARPDSTLIQAESAGRCRVNNPTGYHRYHPVIDAIG
jgi:hypothetical protein